VYVHIHKKSALSAPNTGLFRSLFVHIVTNSVTNYIHTCATKSASSAPNIGLLDLCMYTCVTNSPVCVCIYTARKASWNSLRVEPVHWKPMDIDPGSLVVVQIQNSTEFGVGGTNEPTGCVWGRNPITSKLCLYVYSYIYIYVISQIMSCRQVNK